MLKFKEGSKIQCLLISQLKSASYEEIKVMLDHQKYELPKGYDDFEMIITKTLNKDNSISIVVEFTDYSKPPPLYLPKIMDDYDIKGLSSSMTDGFDIFPDGKIINMHDDVYDDED